jgi:hypothetical protein
MVRGFFNYRYEGLEAGMSPQPVDFAGRLHARDQELINVALQFIPYSQIAILILRLHADVQILDIGISGIGMVDKAGF